VFDGGFDPPAVSVRGFDVAYAKLLWPLLSLAKVLML